MYALDTNAVIHVFKGAGRVGERLLATSPQELAIPAIVVYEIEVGLARSPKGSKQRLQFEQLCAVLQILPFGDDEARSAAKIRTALETAGQQIGPIDVLIAATALHRRATLVTHNAREFGRVPGLAVEDWY